MERKLGVPTPKGTQEAKENRPDAPRAKGLGADEKEGPAGPGSETDGAAETEQDSKTNAPSKEVSEDRKRDLLKKARSDRRKWIQNVPLPYEPKVRDPSNLWTLEDRLLAFQSSPACSRLPSATKVLSELYGLENHTKSPREIAERIESIVGPLHKVDDDDVESAEVDEPMTADEMIADHETITAYHEFWSTLLRPECALLVQGMRNFQRSLLNVPSITLESVSKAIKSYMESTFESLKSHPSWSGRVDENVRRSLESFLYGQFRPIFESLEWSGLFSMTEEEWLDRVNRLQFIDPSHLDIHCLDVDNAERLEELLAEPIRAALSIDQFYSPREKLQQILRLYKSVNESLTSALNSTKASGGERKLPSADDVLPTMILAVLRARPEFMFRNLQMIEVFCPPNLLRGEAGYAFTNLYGAVQFLNDLDMDKPDTLSISADEFRKGLESYQEVAEKRLTATLDSTESEEHKSAPIRIEDVRAARMNGEKVNLKWALDRQQSTDLNGDTSHNISPSSDNDLPSNFSRSYTFLGSRPEDIKLSDLPLLLEEYRNLVKTTEHLINERATRLALERRQKDSKKKKISEEKLLLDDDGADKSRDRALTS